MMQPIKQLPNNIPRANNVLAAWFAQQALRITGWQVVGVIPDEPKLIFAVAPHTSNWDFILGLLVKYAFNLKVNFLGKDSIFVWPFSIWLKSVGGIAVERSNAHGVVKQIVKEFSKQPQLILGLAPEGTRSKVGKWKTGFLHIAKQANIPVVPVQLNFKHKQVMFFEKRMITAAIDDELQQMQNLFSADCAKKPQNF
ncbi:MAG: 1-acyl-sn-glycerol-3-phosphate acyltransferase [Thalassotalea sp.]|nr:1-acyl-sn-glycerol-3-phosphate acyltransferase [Thalassotalea sp.]